MKQKEMKKNRGRCLLNAELLAIKLHYFLYFCALACVMPYRNVFAKQLGISATAVGIAMTILPVLKIITSPLCGALVDHFKTMKLVLVILITIMGISHLAMVFIPGHNDSSIVETGVRSFVQCSSHGSDVTIRDSFNTSCMLSILAPGSNYSCEARCSECYHQEEISNRGNHSMTMMFQGATKLESDNSTVLSFQNVSNDWLNSVQCSCPTQLSCTLHCDLAVYSCFPPQERKNFHETLQFWIFFILLMISGVTLSSAIFISDAACYELLQEKPEKYGQQRLWGTVGWGLGGFTAGYLNDLATRGSPITDFSPGFYVMTALLAVDIAVVLKVDATVTGDSENIFKDVGKLFLKPRVCVFVLTVFLIGVLSGLFWNFQFWYLEDLGASHTLLGLTQAVEGFLAELPFFIFAGKILDKIGHLNALTVTFLCLGFRYVGYAYINNPWLSLPLGLLHGPTFGLFYCAMTSYGKQIAPPGTEATMQTLLGSTFEGVGIAVGGFIGGLGFDYFGGKMTYLTCGIASFILTVLSAFLNRFLVWTQQKNAKECKQIPAEEPMLPLEKVSGNSV